MGRGVPVNSSWQPMQGNRVYFVHVLGANETEFAANSRYFFSGNIFGIMSGTMETTAELFGRQAFVLSELSRNVYGDLTEEGDSGGGVFWEGQLVGVNLGLVGQVRNNETFFRHYFVPISGIVRL